MGKWKDNYWVRQFLTGLVYLVLAEICLFCLSFPSGPSFIWLPSGFALAVLLLMGRQMWLGVFVALVGIVHLQDLPEIARIGFIAGNLGEVLLGAGLLSRPNWFSPGFSRLTDVFRFLVAIGIAAAFGASIAVLGLSMAGTHSGANLLSAWTDWFAADAPSMLIIAASILPWFSPRLESLDKIPNRLHFVSQAAAIFLLEAIIFSIQFHNFALQRISSYALFLSILFFSLRWGLRWGNLLILCTLVFGGIFTLRNHGPFAAGNLRENILTFEIGCGAMMIIVLLIGSALRHLQEALAQARNALSVRDDFLAIASHELNTPLAPIKLQLQHLEKLSQRDSLAAVPKEKLSEGIQSALSELKHFERLVSDLLDVSRIGSIKLQIVPVANVDLSKAVKRVVDRYEEEAKDAQCPVEINLEPNLVGNWDDSRIEQVVTNLLTNAFKYGAGAPVAIRTATKKGFAELIVQDRGPGIDPKDHSRIFHRFERAANIKSYGGLGLGLYITRALVEAHSGTIRVESSPGNGATFTVTLPIDNSYRK